ncbi:MAG TPA: hypothetical protein VG320_29385 [Paraburkholderia sp.]|jgi:hypothetical protein|uniref:hypothetical protein n=1 Tax=Paraburkholderia sp. TaxID=1926495 RepID=UPI002DEE0185|nr:hypothetical protein [Paraburkholderia sp.]
MGNGLVWAAIPHNSDGVVFQVRVIRGLQRFHIPRRVLEEVFGLVFPASDAGQLELFYRHAHHILSRAMHKRPIAAADTAALQATDFTTVMKAQPGGVGSFDGNLDDYQQFLRDEARRTREEAGA